MGHDIVNTLQDSTVLEPLAYEFELELVAPVEPSRMELLSARAHEVFVRMREVMDLLGFWPKLAR